ncbi:hypothetical protein GCM10022254_19580 [Actinomadura meridiana]|uniref:Uncharacterized protein n=1 Tax=Actinomadura meridiana TaxID=559626 RepID=A0ABP8BWM3_9ACTN
MPSQQHDISAELFRWSPELAGELLAEMGVEIPEVVSVQDVSESFIDLKTSEYSGDAAVVMETVDGKRGVVVEVQRWPPTDKEWTWPLYIAILRARQRCPVALLVLAPDPAIAAQCERPIQTGHPNNVLVPLVVRQEHVPFLNDPKEIAADPAMGVLSALYHGYGARSAEVVKSAVQATNLLGDNHDARLNRYYDFVAGVLPEVVRKSLEAMMKTDSPYYSDLFRSVEKTTTAKIIVSMMEGKGVSLRVEDRERILECTDLAQLKTWLSRVVEAKSAADLFG